MIGHPVRKRAALFIIFVLILVCLPRAATASSAVQTAGPFDDITGDEFYGEAAGWLHHAGVFVGDEAGNLRPEEVFTRAHMAVVLARLTGQQRLTEQLASEQTAYADDDQIPDWARGAFVLAHKRDWFIGHEDGTVAPDESLTWAEIAALLARVTENEHLIEGQWPDSAMAAAEQMELFCGIPHSPRADLPILRGQMTSAVWEAMRHPTRSGKEDEGESLLVLHHGPTARTYEEHLAADGVQGTVSVEVKTVKPASDVKVRLQLGHTEHTVVTDSQGAAVHTFDQVKGGRYRVAAEADGFLPDLSEVVITDDAPDASVNLKLTRQPENGDPLTVEEVARRALPATVTIYSTDALGSGFHLGDGMVITNYHVIDGQTGVTVTTHDGDEYSAEGVLAGDMESDAAILHVPDLDAPSLSFSEEKVAVGEKVVAVGSPWGLEGTVSEGIISARRDDPELFVSPLLQTTAAVSQGSSGGPLLNMSAEVVGINTLQMTTGESLNFAVPAAQLQALVQEAAEQEESVCLSELFGRSLSVGELKTWLEQLTEDTIFYASDVWIDDEGETVYFYLAVDFEDYGLLLQQWQKQQARADAEYVMYLLAEHIHTNADRPVFGALTCLDFWRSYPDHLSDDEWDIYLSDDDYWVARRTLLQILMFGPWEYEIGWFGQ